MAIVQANPATTKAANIPITITFGTLTFNINLDQNGTYAQTNQIYPPLNQGISSKLIHAKTTAKGGNSDSLNPSNPIAHDTCNTARNTRNQPSRLVRHTSNAPRFVKAPPATAEWPEVVNRKRNSSTRKKKCFYCNKLGHIQKFCWKKITCYNCGRRGHKYTNCFYKNLRSPSNPKSMQTDKHQQATTTSGSLRSCRSMARTFSVWRPKQQIRIEEKEKRNHAVTTLALSNSHTTPPPHQPCLLFHSTTSITICDIDLAAANQHPISDTQKIILLKQILFLTVPRPVNLRHLSPFLSVTIHTSAQRGAHSGLGIDRIEVYCPHLPSRHKEGALNVLTSGGEIAVALKRKLEAPSREYSNRILSPKKPNSTAAQKVPPTAQHNMSPLSPAEVQN